MKSCLLVDDSRVVRKVTSRILEGLGFACMEAEDGERALQTCKTGLPDLIVLDWNMPVMGGFEFLEKVRGMEHGDHPKIIFCTTENDPRNIQRAMKAGASEYIMKPFDSEILKLKLTKIGLL